jgi:hypothetical protein
MAGALQDNDAKRREIICFRGCAKSTMASLALVLWAALEHPDRYPFIIMLADTRGQASINAASVQHYLRNNEKLRAPQISQDRRLLLFGFEAARPIRRPAPLRPDQAIVSRSGATRSSFTALPLQ